MANPCKDRIECAKKNKSKAQRIAKITIAVNLGKDMDDIEKTNLIEDL